MVVLIIMANQVNILVVEDNITILDSIVHCIEAPHMRVDKAEDGCEALKMLEEMRYDIIITDYHMPNMHEIKTLIERIISDILYRDNA
jgi:CheY-like chemotaxis protein